MLGPGQRGHKPSVRKHEFRDPDQAPSDTKPKPQRKLSIFLPEFKDVRVDCGFEYRCIPLDDPIYKHYQDQADFSQTKRTVQDRLMHPNSPTARIQTSVSLGPQLFAVRLATEHSDWSQCEDTGQIEMIHMQTLRICRGYYTQAIIHSKGARQGIILFQDVVITDRYAY